MQLTLLTLVTLFAVFFLLPCIAQTTTATTSCSSQDTWEDDVNTLSKSYQNANEVEDFAPEKAGTQIIELYVRVTDIDNGFFHLETDEPACDIPFRNNFFDPKSTLDTHHDHQIIDMFCRYVAGMYAGTLDADEITLQPVETRTFHQIYKDNGGVIDDIDLWVCLADQGREFAIFDHKAAEGDSISTCTYLLNLKTLMIYDLKREQMFDLRRADASLYNHALVPFYGWDSDAECFCVLTVQDVFTFKYQPWTHRFVWQHALLTTRGNAVMNS